MSPAAVTIAVVSWNTRALLVECLDSLAGEAEAGRADVWVVDNGSTDGSAATAREHAPWARVIEPGDNLGFGRAVNLVAGQTTSEWIACANADVALTVGALDALLGAGEDSRVGCVAPRLVLPDGASQHSCYPLPTLTFTLAFNLGLPRVAPAIGDRWCLEGYWDSRRPRAVPWAIGAFLLLRRSAFAAVGGFDERQWMYAEDLDLGWRLHDAGWRTRYEPNAAVRHASAAATGPAFGAGRRARFTTATYAVIARRHGRGRARAIALVNVAGAALRLAWLGPLALVSRGRRPAARDVAGWLRVHLRGLVGPRAAGAR